MSGKQIFTTYKDAKKCLRRMRGWPNAIIQEFVDEEDYETKYIICASPLYGDDGEIIGGLDLDDDGYVR